MHACTHMHAHTHTHMHAHTYMHTHTHTHTHMNAYTDTHTQWLLRSETDPPYMNVLEKLIKTTIQHKCSCM